MNASSVDANRSSATTTDEGGEATQEIQNEQGDLGQESAEVTNPRHPNTSSSKLVRGLRRTSEELEAKKKAKKQVTIGATTLGMPIFRGLGKNQSKKKTPDLACHGDVQPRGSASLRGLAKNQSSKRKALKEKERLATSQLSASIFRGLGKNQSKRQPADHVGDVNHAAQGPVGIRGLAKNRPKRLSLEEQGQHDSYHQQGAIILRGLRKNQAPSVRVQAQTHSASSTSQDSTNAVSPKIQRGLRRPSKRSSCTRRPSGSNRPQELTSQMASEGSLIGGDHPSATLHASEGDHSASLDLSERDQPALEGRQAQPSAFFGARLAEVEVDVDEYGDDSEQASWTSSSVDSDQASSTVGAHDANASESPENGRTDMEDSLLLSRLSNEDLVEATPVVEPQLPFGEAHEVEMQELERRATKEAEERRCRRFGYAIIFTCALFLGSVIAGVQGREKSIAETRPPMPLSTAPSGAPTPAPTEALDSLWESLPISTLDRIGDQSSPQGQGWSWLSSHQNIASLEDARKKQLFALATFYYAFEGPRWREEVRARWIDDTIDDCTWFSSIGGAFTEGTYFVSGAEYDRFVQHAKYEVESCNEHGEIQALVLADLQLANSTPHIPPEIALLTSLSILSLPYNDLGVPLHEMLPSELFTLTKLSEINLHNNRLNGTIPVSIPLSISYLGLEGNKIGGSLPTELGSLTHMVELRIWGNNLSGSLPSELGLLTNMTELTLNSGNRFSSELPSELAQLTNLAKLEIIGNRLSGSLPSEFGLMASIKRLRLTDNRLSGFLPSELALLSNLDTLTLDFNRLSGTLPSELGLMENLSAMILDSNALSGMLPSELGLSSNLRALRVADNILTGSIPTDLAGGLTRLSFELTLSNNSLSGQIPSELGLITKVRFFDLSSNSFWGALPSELGLATNLISLGLSNLPLLTGSIPSVITTISSLKVLNISGSSNLSGTLAGEVCSLQEDTCSFFYFGDQFNCSLDFNCTHLLCGCSCPCLSRNGTSLIDNNNL